MIHWLWLFPAFYLGYIFALVVMSITLKERTIRMNEAVELKKTTEIVRFLLENDLRK